MNAIELTVFASRISAVCDEMGAVLRRAAFSPNIKDRLDYSCAVFDHGGELCAQAAHIPVHLGSMAYAMRDIVSAFQWAPGDMLILNDPFLGGTHLPDVTLVAPFYAAGELCGFVANRAHHADIGADAPGSMPVSRSLSEEGFVISPSFLMRGGKVDESRLAAIVGATSSPRDARGDFSAQISANRTGLLRLDELIGMLGRNSYANGLNELNGYAERLARSSLEEIPPGTYSYRDYMDDDGCGNRDVAIAVTLQVGKGAVHADFSATAGQVAGNINCPLSVAAAAVYYVFRCLMPAWIPDCAGSLRPVSLTAPAGCLINARPPAAVAAGNVETSSRVVDVVLGALAQALPERIPAASQGTMNNLAMGSRRAPSPWAYYETIAGGMGAGANGQGLSAVQTHMTNTLNTPVEALEMTFPVRVTRYEVRRGSGGDGARRGGDGVVREYQFLADTQVTVLSERRRHRPWGMAGGSPGQAGRNELDGRELPAKVAVDVTAGQRLTISTPGGGGWGEPPRKR